MEWLEPDGYSQRKQCFQGLPVRSGYTVAEKVEYFVKRIEAQNQPADGELEPDDDECGECTAGAAEFRNTHSAEYEQRVQRYFQQKTGDLDCHDHFRTCHGIIQGIVDKEIQGCRQGKSQNAKVIRSLFPLLQERGIGNCKKRLGENITDRNPPETGTWRATPPVGLPFPFR